MGFLDNLVVGVDGSAASTVALRWAATRVGIQGTVHAVNAATSEVDDSEISDQLDQLGLRWKRDAAVEQCWKDQLSGRSHKITTRTIKGDATVVLLDIARKLDACAIVVGPHSSPLNRWTLGSVTRKLVHRSSIPLIVVVDGDEPDLSQTRAGSPVVSCIGYGHATEEAAMWAANYAAHHNLSLSLLHVLSPRPLFPGASPTEMLGSYFGSDVSKEWAMEDLRDLQARIRVRWPDLSTETRVDFGASVPAILTAAANAELIVLGKRHWNVALRAIISPRIRRVISKSETAVAVIPSCSTD